MDMTVHFLQDQSDIDREAFACLGAASVPVVCLGHLALLDLADSPLLHPSQPFTRLAMLEAVYIMWRGPAAVEPIRQVAAGLELNMADAELPETVAACITDDDYLEAVYGLIRRSVCDARMALAMIHPRPRKNDQRAARVEPSPGNRTYGSPEYIARIIAALAETGLRATHRDLLWSVPFALVSHLLAATAVDADIYRPRDPEKTAEALRRLNPQPRK